MFRPDPEAAAALRAQLRLDDRPVLGLFGEFKAKRGLERLWVLGDDDAGYSLLLVGKMRPEVRNVAPERAIVLDWIDDEARLCAAYSLCTVVLQPLHRDGMSNVVLEAMAGERIVVASRAGGLPDLITHGENGFLFDTDEEMRDILLELRDSPPFEVGRLARERVPRPHVERDAFLAVAYEAIARYAEMSASR